MAFFVLCGSNSSFSTRFYISALIALVLVCCCSSYCSSTPIVSPVIDAEQLPDNTYELKHNEKDIDNVRFRLNPYSHLSEQAILPSDDQLIQLLIQSALNQDYYTQSKQNRKRYTQSFHAMRG